MDPAQRSRIAFAVSDFANSYGGRVPEWLCRTLKLVNVDICNPNKTLSEISQDYAILAVEASGLDYQLSQDFLAVGHPDEPDFPTHLEHYLDDLIQPAISRDQ